MQKETESIFSKIVAEINAKIRGKAPLISDFKIDGNYVDMILDCNHEDLLPEEGDAIESTVKRELGSRGLSWIKAGFSPSYFGK